MHEPAHIYSKIISYPLLRTFVHWNLAEFSPDSQLQNRVNLRPNAPNHPKHSFSFPFLPVLAKILRFDADLCKNSPNHPKTAQTIPKCLKIAKTGSIVLERTYIALVENLIHCIKVRFKGNSDVLPFFISLYT